MRETFKCGDQVEWNSDAGRVRGVVIRKVTMRGVLMDFWREARAKHEDFVAEWAWLMENEEGMCIWQIACFFPRCLSRTRRRSEFNNPTVSVNELAREIQRRGATLLLAALADGSPP